MDTTGHETRRLFQFLRRRWLPEPDLREGFLKSLDGFSKLQEHLRDHKELDRLSQHMYPDLQSLIAELPAEAAPVPQGKARSSKDRSDKLTIPEVHEILHIMQTMEVAWLNARMEDFDAHPLNRGWVAVFHRWSMMPEFRHVWPVLRADFSRSFVEYLQSRFSLAVEYSSVEPLPGPTTASKRVREILLNEYRSEWPEIDPTFLSPRSERVLYVYPSIRKSSGLPDDCWQLKDVPLGFVALLPRAKQHQDRLPAGTCSCDDDAPELRFWVRPQYRFLGVGRHLLNTFALKALANLWPIEYETTKTQKKDQEAAWNCRGELVTRYFVRTGQEGGHSLRRRMQLGFLYEYSFRRHEDRPYDEPPRDEVFADRSEQTQHPSERGLIRGNTVNPQESIVPTVLRTTWHEFFEAARSMSSNPQQF
ncbi:hypothetical protein GC176_03070 [bacterium]|nr:hypothetical protein [bacterium]